jgi:site-specific DNA-methyltransferase (adenine-specific)
MGRPLLTGGRFFMVEKTLRILDSNIRLLYGDCIEVMNTMDKNSVDLIAVDIPYGKTQNKWDTVIPFEPMWCCIKHVLKPTGTVVCTAAQPFTSQLVLSNLDWFKYDIVWQKTIGSGQLNINRQPLRMHESIIVFYDKFGTYNEQTTDGKPYKINRKTEGFVGNYGKQRDNTKVNSGFRHAKSVVKIPNPRIKNGHKTEKPVKLMEYIVRAYSNVGDVVLDFAMGRGTTGIACVNLKRNFIGIELSEEWYNKSIERFKEIYL